MAETQATDAYRALQSLLDLYGAGHPDPLEAVADLARVGPQNGHLGTLADRYGDRADEHSATATAHSDRDSAVREAVATSADITATGRRQVVGYLDDFRTQLQAISTISDIRLSGPAVLAAAHTAITKTTQQVAADTTAATHQAARIMPPATPTLITGRNTRPRRRPRSRRRGMPVTDGTAGGNAVQAAGAWLGTPYVWGGGTAGGPTGGGFDCSGLTQYAIAQASDGHVVLPRTTYEQIHSGTRIPVQDVRPGDLVFPASSFSARGPEHVQLAAGNGMVIEAPHSGATVQMSRMPRDAIVVRVL
ncbi:C40 family peptidase [Nocardia stercoris]|nr:C40 family peptidase [Nocardia stercoris]